MRQPWIAFARLVAVGSVVAAAWALPKAEPLNDTCPISGKAIDRSKTSEVKVGFCCANCKGKFDQDPTAWLGKVDKVPNEQCPLSGKSLGEAVSTVTIGFCSSDCKAKFDKEPASYLGKVQAAKKEDQ